MNAAHTSAAPAIGRPDVVVLPTPATAKATTHRMARRIAETRPSARGCGAAARDSSALTIWLASSLTSTFSWSVCGPSSVTVIALGKDAAGADAYTTGAGAAG